MTTTNELPPPNLEQKIDMLIQLVNDFRYTLLERLDKVEADSRERYVDLRQRIDKIDARTAALEQRMATIETRLVEMDERLSRIEHEVAFLTRQYHHIDRKLDIFVTEFNLLKDRVRDAEDTQMLRN